LIEKALNFSIIKELDYPVTIQNEIIEVSEEQQPQPTLEVAVSNSLDEFIEQNPSEGQDNQKVELDKLVRYMQEHPDLIVELGSHTDSRGSDSYNVRLAERRSNSCVSYIKSNGIPNENIIAKGYGEKQLVNNCSNDVKCSKEDHQLNRRTELKIKLD
jgi:outer membrane protein OmpA-like peptidoglycan-associated protein